MFCYDTDESEILLPRLHSNVGWLVLSFCSSCQHRAFMTQPEQLYTQPEQPASHRQLLKQPIQL